MKLKRLTAFFLVIALSISFTLPAYAADNSKVDAKIATLEQKYDISIKYDTNANGGACIGTGALATLDSMLAVVTPEVTKEVSSYINKRMGRKLTYNFTYDYNSDHTEALGAFGPTTGIIAIYVPSNSSQTFASGDNPLTMIHEFGHALHLMIEENYGASALKSEWISLNGSIQYKGAMGDGRYSDTTFFSEYAATEYGEDFAETFAHCVIRNRAGLGFSYLLNKDGALTNLGKKVDLLTGVLSKAVTNSAGLTANIKNNASNTPIYVSFRGVSLYGINLQYIGCSWPNHVFKGIMAEIGEEAQTSEWLYELGGWYTQANSGNYYLIFPGGFARLLNAPLKAAA